MHFSVTPSKVTDASLVVPGDKSVSHRALLLGSIAKGRTTVSGFLAGDDCLATLAAMRTLGVDIEQAAENGLSIDGVGIRGLRSPNVSLDLGNSGTAMRLMAGLMSGQTFSSELRGDESLSRRPMARVIKPLALMGTRIDSDDGTPPLIVHGSQSLKAIDYAMPVASAQVKSSVLLAGLYAAGTTTVTEPAVTRDHTERMMRSMGAGVMSQKGRISIDGGQSLRAAEIHVPGDLSSAAFVILAALLAERADVLVRNVGVNPTRTGVIDILQSMGADIGMENPRSMGTEPVADIRVRSSDLRGVTVDPMLVSLAIDEFPVLFVAAAAATGATEFQGIGELRVKESDRIAAMAAGLRALAIRIEEGPEAAVVYGGRFRAGTVLSDGDHRVAMAMAVAGLIADGDVIVEDVAAVNTSFPGFTACMSAMGADIQLMDDLE